MASRWQLDWPKPSTKERVKYAFFAGLGLIDALVAQALHGNHEAVRAKAHGM
jgi:hypothetical protein